MECVVCDVGNICLGVFRRDPTNCHSLLQAELLMELFCDKIGIICRKYQRRLVKLQILDESVTVLA